MKKNFSKLSFWYFSIPFRRKTIAFFMLIVLIVSLLSEGMGSVFYRNMLTQEISRQLYGTLSKIDDNISQSMNAVEQVSGALNANEIIHDYITADFDSIEQSKIASSVPDNLLSIIMDSNDEISSIYISRANAVSLHQGKLFDYAWESIKLSSIFELADQQQGEPAWVYDYYTTSHLLTENNRIVSNARVVYDEAGQPEALILVNLKESAIADALTVESNESGSSYLIMDREGTAVAHSKNSFFDEYTARLPFVDKILADHNSFSFTINETDYLVNWVSSKDYDWYIVSFTPIEYMDTYMVNILYIVLISLAISMILATILSALFSRSLTSSITRLSGLFPKIEQGDFSVRAPVHGNDEVNRLSLQFNNMLTKLQDTINELSKEQVTKQLIEMNALQEQINPHFLYNTLESINSLAILRGYDDISRLVLALSHMLRLSVNKGNSFLTLEQEIEHAKNYLYIQNIRYENKFRLIDAVPEELRGNSVIKLLLQPLIENSILHGFERKEKDCIILVRACRQGDRLLIKVVDNGSGIPQDKLKDIYTALHDDRRPEKGIYGIYNINQRIRLYYGDGYGIRYASSLGHYTAAIIELRYNDTIGEKNV